MPVTKPKLFKETIHHQFDFSQQLLTLFSKISIFSQRHIMQNKTHLLHGFLLLVLTALSGCGRKKESSNQHKTPFFSKTRHKHKQKRHQEVPAEAVKAFDLDDDSMKTFALDDKLEQQPATVPTSSPTQQEKNSLFSWENLAAEESKNAFRKLIFEFDSYGLQPNQQADLKHNIKQAKRMIREGKKIVIEGHACHSAGSAIYNLALSEKRARHVAKKFADAGIDAKHIKIAPRGHEMPIVQGGSRAEQAANRRVEIFAIDAD